MEYRYKLTGKVKGGKRVYDNPQLLQRHLMSLEGCEFEEICRKRRLPATKEQLGFYFVILKEAHKHDAFIHYPSPKRVHDAVIAPMFLEEYVEGGTKIKNLAELSKDEIKDLIDRVIAFLKIDFEIEIGDPENYVTQ